MKKRVVCLLVLVFLLTSVLNSSFANIGNLEHVSDGYIGKIREYFKPKGIDYSSEKLDYLLKQIREQKSDGTWNLTGNILNPGGSGHYVDPSYNAGLSEKLGKALTNAAKDNIAFAMKNKKFSFPLEPSHTNIISSAWGERNISYGSRHHNGLDISTKGKAPTNRPSKTCSRRPKYLGNVLAAADGVVTYKGIFCGNTMEIKHTIDLTGVGQKDFYTSYLHLDQFMINPRTNQEFKKGDKILKGDIIALTGCSGNTRGTNPGVDNFANHLHFTIADTPIDGKIYKFCSKKAGESGYTACHNRVRDFVIKHTLNPIFYTEIPKDIQNRTLKAHGIKNLMTDTWSGLPYYSNVTYEWRR